MVTRLIRSSATTLDTEEDVSPPKEDDLVSKSDRQDVDELHHSPGLEVSRELVRCMTMVPDQDWRYVPDCKSIEVKKFSYEDLIKVCPEGTCFSERKHIGAG